MIERGVDPNQTDSEVRTALGYAAYKGNDEMVRTLLEGGADVNSRDDRGLTPVTLAAAEGHESTLEILLKAGGNIQLGISWNEPLFGLLLPREIKRSSSN